MKVILVFVSTLNGKITKGDDPEVKSWSSKNDQEYYGRIWKDSRLIIMGSNTYNENIIKPSKGRMIVIMTRNPDFYKNHEIPGQLEFSNNSPSGLVAFYEKAGFEQMTVVGGSKVATSFLKENQVDELWLTIEPKMFGKGQNLIADDPLEIYLQLLGYEKVNEQGTLITRYSILKTSDLQS